MQQYKKILGKVMMTAEGTYDNNKKYDPISLITDEETGKSYISRKEVPVGTQVNNREYWQPVASSGIIDNGVIILNRKNNDGQIPIYDLKSATEAVAVGDRKGGVILGFLGFNPETDTVPTWKLYQYNDVSPSNWTNIDYWLPMDYTNKYTGWFDNEEALYDSVPFPKVGMYAYVGNSATAAIIYRCYVDRTWQATEDKAFGGVVNLADEEDITSKQNKLKFKDKEYNPAQYNGMGRIYLRKNMIDGKNVLTQKMIEATNTIYIIQYDYDLQGAEITIPEGCTLDFQGGSFSNGTIIGDNTIILSSNDDIFPNITFDGSFDSEFETRWIKGSSKEKGEYLNNIFTVFDKVILTEDINITSTIVINEKVFDLNGYRINVDSDVTGIQLIRLSSVRNGEVCSTIKGYSKYLIHVLSKGDGVFTSSLCLSNIKLRGTVKSSDTERYGGYAIVLEAVCSESPTSDYDSFICFRTFENISISGVENGLYLKCGDGRGKPLIPYINSNIFKNFIFEGCFNCLICQVVKDTSISTDSGGEIVANIFDGFTVQAWAKEQETIIKFVGQVARNIITNAFIWDLFDNSNKLLQLDQWSVKNYIFSNIFDNSVVSNNIYEHGHDELQYINVVRNYMTATDVNPTVRGRLTLRPVQDNGLPTPADGRIKGIGTTYTSADDSNDMTIHAYGNGRSGIKFFTYKDYSTTSGTEVLHLKFDGAIYPKGFVHFLSKPFIAFEKPSSYAPTYNNEVYYLASLNTLAINHNGVDYMLDGHRAVTRRGSTSSRPVMYEFDFGFPYFDTTLNKPIWWNGSAWVDATGTKV